MNCRGPNQSSSWCVYFLRTDAPWGILCRSRPVTAKRCTKLSWLPRCCRRSCCQSSLTLKKLLSLLISFICCWIAEADCYLKWTCHQSHWPHHISARGLGRRTECRYFSHVFCCGHIHRDYLVLKIRFSMNSNDIEPEQVVHTHWTSHRSSWPRGFDLIPILTPEYLLPVSVDSSPPSYLFTSATVRLHQSVKQNLSDTWRSIFGFGAAQPHSVTEMAPKWSFLCANRSPNQYDFRAGAKAIPYCVNIAYGPVTD